MTIELYAFEHADGTVDSFTTHDAEEAQDHARAHGLRWMAYSFEFTDSELVMDFSQPTEDFTPKTLPYHFMESPK